MEEEQGQAGEQTAVEVQTQERERALRTLIATLAKGEALEDFSPWPELHGPSAARQRAYLTAYSLTGNHVKASELAGCGRWSHYNWVEDPVYAAAWERAKEIAARTLESEIIRRAHEGVVEPVFYRGVVCGHIRKYSDILAIFAMKAMDPKYRDNSQVNVTVGLDGNLLDSLQAGRRRLAEARGQTIDVQAETVEGAETDSGGS